MPDCPPKTFFMQEGMEALPYKENVIIMKQKPSTLIKDELGALKQNSDSVLNKTILFITVVLFIYCYFGSYSFFDKTFQDTPNPEYFRIIYHHVACFVLFFVVGLLYTKLIVKKNPKEMGLGFGDHKTGLVLCAAATVIMPLLGLSCVTDPEMVASYPLVDLHIFGQWYYVLGYFGSYLLYYIGWEYLFRGIGLFGTEGKMGPLGAILFTGMISALIHTSIGGFGKPMLETLSAIPAGLIFGWVAYKTKSIYYSLYMHIVIGFATDLAIFLLR